MHQSTQFESKLLSYIQTIKCIHVRTKFALPHWYNLELSFLFHFISVGGSSQFVCIRFARVFIYSNVTMQIRLPMRLLSQTKEMIQRCESFVGEGKKSSQEVESKNNKSSKSKHKYNSKIYIKILEQQPKTPTCRGRYCDLKKRKVKISSNQ